MAVTASLIFAHVTSSKLLGSLGLSAPTIKSSVVSKQILASTHKGQLLAVVKLPGVRHKVHPNYEIASDT